MKLNHILHNLVSIVHLEMFKGILRVSNGIKRTKVGSEFLKESSVTVFLCQQIPQIWMEDVCFKPVKSSAREKRNSVVDFTGICHKSSGSVIKIQLEGANESLEFPWVGAIQSVTFFDFSADVIGLRFV